MRIERELINNLVPESLPPENLISNAARAASERLANTPTLQRSYLWATAIVEAGFRSDIGLPPRFGHFSAGVVALPSDAVQNRRLPGRPVGGAVFGGYVLSDELPNGAALEFLRIGEYEIPILIAFGAIALHGRPPGLGNGVSTCWAEQTGKRAWRAGIVTARHVVAGIPKGMSLPLQPSRVHSHPTYAVLAEKDQCTIDAVILAVNPRDCPPTLKTLPVCDPAVPTQAVSFEDAAGTTQHGSVLRVFHSGTYYGNLLGQRVITDCYGVPGDSGALLVDANRGDGVGLYMGTIPDGTTGKDEGIHQDLSQVTKYFSMRLYQ